MVFYLVSFDKLVGMQIITSKAHLLGEAKSIEINTESWQVTHIFVKLDNEAAIKLGVKKRFRSSKICIPISMVKAVGELITIDASFEDLKNSFEITECKD
jgi:sporulation protein YlmC with PRC-barrel domain